MIGDLVKRLLNGVVVLFAGISFFLVPVGGKTAAQHLVAILTTPPAREAASAFGDIARKLTARVVSEVGRLRR